MKLFAPLLLSGVLAGQKENIAAQCQASKALFPDCKCSDIYWKGAQQGKSLIPSVQDGGDVAFFQISIPDDASTWKFRDSSDADKFNPNFKIFLQFARHKCGVTFLEGVAAGDVEFHFMDTYAAYGGTVYHSAEVAKVHEYPVDYFPTGNVPAKKYWTVAVQGHSANTLQKSPYLHNDSKMRGDLPYDAKADVFATKKDQIQVLVTGLKGVTFSDAQRDACFAGAFVGIAEWDGETMEDDTECLGLAHLFW